MDRRVASTLALLVGCLPARTATLVTSRPSTAISVVEAPPAEVGDVRGLVARATNAHFAESPGDVDELVLWPDDDVMIPLFVFFPTRAGAPGTGARPPGFAAPESAPRLLGVVTMATGWRDDAADLAKASASPRGLLGILAEETAHAWSAYVRAPAGVALLGREGAHWSFFADTGGSVLGGNAWRALGDGRYAAAPPSGIRYAPIDLYLMGLAAPSEVAPMRVLRDVEVVEGHVATDRASRPIVVTAHETTVDVAELAALNGPRDVSASRVIRQRWAVMTASGGAPSKGTIDALERLRVKWEEVFALATGGRARIDTRH